MPPLRLQTNTSTSKFPPAAADALAKPTTISESPIPMGVLHASTPDSPRREPPEESVRREPRGSLVGLPRVRGGEDREGERRRAARDRHLRTTRSRGLLGRSRIPPLRPAPSRTEAPRRRQPRRPIPRALLAPAAAALLLAGCAEMPGASSTPPPPTTRTTTPRAALSSSLRGQLVPPGAGVQVRAGRFVRGVELDRGTMVVLPPSATEHPALPEADANRLFRSDAGTTGTPGGIELGFGRVSLPPSMTTAAGFAELRDTPAWVGITWGGTWSCPMERASVDGRATTGRAAHGAAPRRRAAHAAILPATPGDLAVVILSPTRVIDFASGGSPCPGTAQPPARVTTTTEAISVPWSLVSQAGFTIRYRYRAPACAPGLVPLPQAVGNLDTGAMQLRILLDVPYPDVACRGVLRSGHFDLGPPPGAASLPAPAGAGPTVSHGPTGPVQVVGNPLSIGLHLSAGP